MADTLFDTWEGDDSTFEGDLSRVLEKHKVAVAGLSAEQLTIFVTETLRALGAAEGSTSEFSTSMFIMYKQLEIGSDRSGRYHYGPSKRASYSHP